VLHLFRVGDTCHKKMRDSLRVVVVGETVLSHRQAVIRRCNLMACSKLLSFAELVQGRDSSVRVTDDGKLDVVDLVMVVTGKNCNHSNELLRNVKSSLFDNDFFVIYNQRRYVTLEHAITLIMVLPGKMAKEIRSQFAAIIERHIKIQHDSASGVTTVMLQSDPVEDHEARRKRVKREDLEMLKLEEEIKGMAQTRIIAASLEIERIRDPTRSNLDDRTRLMMQDALQNSILNSTSVAPSGSGGAGQGLITDGDPSPNAPISISGVAAKLGYRPNTNDAKRIGGDLRKRYLRLHNKPPPKHDQLCDGRVTLVNSYTESDRPLVEEALHAYFRPAGSESDD
jgi:hypothetical protein